MSKPEMPAFSHFLENSTHEMQKDAIRAYAKQFASACVEEALTRAYNAMFDIKGDKVTRFDAQTAIRKIKEEMSNG